MKRGSAVVVGSKDESDAISLYKTLLSKNWLNLGCKYFIN
jgi:hypothetical protein